MLVYAVDVGTTNTKVVLFDGDLHRLAVSSAPAVYHREDVSVEFDASTLFESVLDLIHQCSRAVADTSAHDAVIVLTGQAESLVLNDEHGRPVRPGMSWLDDRAATLAVEIAERFGTDAAFAVTGQPVSSATWPAAKLRWLGHHEPAVLEKTAAVLMVKDEMIRRLTGAAAGEVTTRGFTYMYDVRARHPWSEMLDYLAVDPSQLAETVPAGTDVGEVQAAVLDRLPRSASYRVNAGALDHFCAMVGTGSYRPRVVSESAGTVLSLSVLTEGWTFDEDHKVSFHAGLETDDVVLFNGVDSGGVALDWYRREGLSDMGYDELERRLRARGAATAPIFLPYLTGVNPPDFFADAHGAFLGLTLGHDRIDLAYAVEEGIAHLLHRNVEYLQTPGPPEIVSTGGGAASSFWNQLKADVCGVDVVVPDEQEATCRGAAVLALRAAGGIDDIADAAHLNQPAAARYTPTDVVGRAERYRRFDDYLNRLFDH
ncbi:FGGY-family carbohydrate kinase [Solicola sp. PLA-1-18]|uniref:FGGY-family carbohydrate kinase n=1 Tax=Solicola sp. PLA-1-18 TaxID=3380532 RepID=UPI003B77FD2D